MSTTQMLAIDIKNINKTFGEGDNKTQVLYDIEAKIPTGEIVLIVGPSGCGKTTLISIIAGILSCDSGEINLFDAPIHKLNTDKKALFRQYNVGFIFQQFNLVNTLTITENVAVPLLIQGQPSQYAYQKATEILIKVGLEDKLDKRPTDLSGGQQQRVAIARALVNEPKIVICDEPTSALDGPTGKIIMEMLKQIALKPDRCVLIVTHDNRIFNYANRIIEMEDGRIINTITSTGA